ncbi:MAG: hypothetical protein P8M18_12610 [Woeseiaceae bacterium]|nr:hypothetical protein [Woeseiaceae bacterium]
MNEVGCNEHVVTKPDHFIGAAEEIQFLPLQMSVSKAKTLRGMIMGLESPENCREEPMIIIPESISILLAVND